MATYYWVGGNGTWDGSNKTNWATSSGGAGGNGPPTSNDTVNFDSNSGTGTCTTASGSACSLATLNSSTLGLSLGANHTMNAGFVLTLGNLSLGSFTLSCATFTSNNTNVRSIAFGTGNITLTGSNVFVLSMANVTNFTWTGTATFNATYSGSTGTRSFRFGATGGTESNSPNLNIKSGTDAVSVTTITIKNLDFTGFSGVLNNSTITSYGNLTFSSGMTCAAGSGTTTFAATSGTQTITTNGKTLDFPMTFNGVGGTWSFAEALTQGSTRAFTITNGTVKLKAGATSTVGALATSGSNQKYLQSTTAGSQATLSQASGTVTVSYLSIKDIAATGGATWNAYVDYNNVDQGDNTGWDFSYSPAIDNEFPVALRSFTQPKRF